MKGKLKPLKRHTALQPLSRQHHYGLLLCFKLRQGFAKNIEPTRMKRYVDWFYENHIIPHFEMEEKHIFPVLGNDHELIIRALEEHKTIMSLFEEDQHIETSLKELEKALDAHIRFEERILFEEIQQVASPGQMKEINALHDESDFQENTEDEFWK